MSRREKMDFNKFPHFLIVFSIIAPVFIYGLAESSNSKVLVETDSSLKNLRSFHGDDFSILVHRNGVMNDEATEAPEQGFQSNTTKNCVDYNCCYQYTWPGYLPPDKLPTPQNATCEAMKSSTRHPGMACFAPLVYSTKPNRPNLTALIEYCDLHGCGIYCSKSGNANTCVKYTFYTNEGKHSTQINETRFCGSVTDSGSGSRVKTGCYSDKRDGLVRTVCVCDGDRCNGSIRLGFSFLLILPIFGVLMKDLTRN